MTYNWALAFRVGSTQDKDTRYSEALESTNIPEICMNDVQSAHDSVWTDFTNNGEPTKPYAVYLSGWREDDQTYDISTYINTNA